MRSSTDRVTFVIEKRPNADDGNSASATSISSITRDVVPVPLPEYQQGNAAVLSTPTSITKSILKKNNKKRRDVIDGELQRVDPSSLRKKMVADGSMIISRDTEIASPIPILANESWKLSGAIILGIKKMSDTENHGLRIGIKETRGGRVLYVAGIDELSPFSKTPLRAEDVILSINNVSLRENADVVDAYAALGKAGKDITLVARKAETSLNDFFLIAQSEKPEGTVSSVEESMEPTSATETARKSIKLDNNSSDSNFVQHGEKTWERQTASPFHPGPNSVRPSNPPSPTSQSSHSSRSKFDVFEFDEESYGATLYGYNSSKNVTIVKSNPLEDVGIELIALSTEWGKLLTVSRLSPTTQKMVPDLEVGDAVLRINGISFGESPDVERAVSVMKRARRDVHVEYQKFSLFSRAVPLDPSEPVILENPGPETSEITKDVPFDSFEGRSREAEEFRPPHAHLGAIEEESDGKSSVSSLKAQEPQREQSHKFKTSNAGGNSVSQQKEANKDDVHKRKRKKLWITVHKQYQRQEIGINFAAMNNRLLITKISPTGMLVGVPVMPGDTVLSINGVNFRRNPDAKEAYLTILSAPNEVILEISKTGFAIDSIDSGTGHKHCFGSKLICSRRKQVNPRLSSSHNDKGTETEAMLKISPGESIDDIDPIYV